VPFTVIVIGVRGTAACAWRERGVVGRGGMRGVIGAWASLGAAPAATSAAALPSRKSRRRVPRGCGG
jgi:hypothetical protein